MPKKMEPLSDVQCRALRYQPEAGRAGNRLRDGGGLYLEVLASGRRVWRLKYKGALGENIATLPVDYGRAGGSLSDARQWRYETKALVKQGIDPNQHAKAEEQARQAAVLATFAAAADEWREHKAPNWSQSQRTKVEGIIRRALLPWIGRRPIGEVTPQELLSALQVFEKKDQLETAHRAREYASAIFRRSIILGLRKDDPAAPLKGALRPVNRKNMAHVKGADAIGELLRAIEGFTGTPEVHAALKLVPMVFTRPGELRASRWNEFDLDGARWDIPAERMKMRRPHFVPLSAQAVSILRDLEPLTRHAPDGLLFPGFRSRRKPISENTLNASLRRLGYTKDQQTAHGFRHIASTCLHDLGWPSHVVEAQLSHADKDTIRGTYNKAEYMAERIKMMQAWADHLDSLKAGGQKVVPIGIARA